MTQGDGSLVSTKRVIYSIIIQGDLPDKTKLPTHISVEAENCGLAKNSIVLLEQVRTIDKRRLKERMGVLDNSAMGKVDKALGVSFGLG